jgi:2',3'-cyclic-nucleotide 2'-phosphodiesterase (5'-nucleotidase family)
MRSRRLAIPVLALALALGPGARAKDGSVRSLTILHTNDLHGRMLPDPQGRGGFARLAAAIRRECDHARACLVLDAGDLAQGSPVSSIYRGVPIFEVANLVGFDASTLGNHEFDYGWRMIPRFREAARFPIITANVVDDDGALLADRAWVVLKRGGVRVGIIGVLTGELRFLTTSDRIGPWQVLPVVKTVGRHATEVARRADLVVVLGHLSDEEEDAILAELPGVPLLVSGHEHDGLDVPKVVDGRVGVRVRGYGRELGRLDLQVDVEADAVVDWKWKTIPIEAEGPEPDPRVAARVARWEAAVADRTEEVIGEAKRLFPREEIRTLLERILRESEGADLAYVNPGGIRDTLPPGPLRVRHVWNVMPFDNHVVVGELAGRDLPDWLVKERGLDPDATYRLATMDFCVATWRDRGSADPTVVDTGRLVRDVMVEWIRKRQVLE